MIQKIIIIKKETHCKNGEIKIPSHTAKTSVHTQPLSRVHPEQHTNKHVTDANGQTQMSMHQHSGVRTPKCKHRGVNAQTPVPGHQHQTTHPLSVAPNEHQTASKYKHPPRSACILKPYPTIISSKTHPTQPHHPT